MKRVSASSRESLCSGVQPPAGRPSSSVRHTAPHIPRHGEGTSTGQSLDPVTTNPALREWQDGELKVATDPVDEPSDAIVTTPYSSNARVEKSAEAIPRGNGIQRYIAAIGTSTVNHCARSASTAASRRTWSSATIGFTSSSA